MKNRPIHRWRLAEFRGLFAVPEALPFAEERAKSRTARAECQRVSCRSTET